MAGGMTGHGQYPQAQARLRYIDAIAGLQRVSQARDGLTSRSVDRTAKMGHQLGDARGVIAVVMGNEDGGQAPTLGAKPRQNGRCITRINNHGRVAAIADHPDIVVSKGGDGINKRHGTMLAGWLHDRNRGAVTRNTTTMATFETNAPGAWAILPAGAALAEAVNAELEQILPSLFGYHLVSVGCYANALDTGASPIRHRLRLGLEGGAQLCGDPAALPVLSDSVDVVLLAQLLDFHDNPHRVLREAARAVIPGGSLVIVGFNPVSLWGLWRLANRGDSRRGSRALTPGRVRDWLGVLGFETTQERRFFYRPPRPQKGPLRSAALDSFGRRWLPRFGSLYLLVARKQISTLTPVRLGWTPNVIAIHPALTEPGARASAKTAVKPSEKI